ncbi:hypothetical protein [Desulfosporosinus sp. HMP52]|uniref:hypothetical protein n=1 Tax=Desulfosporosinus sp. HMP52 TaxID=1487923 RepID=UPI000A5C4329|nr:hypothetical protein [Desulfosporosinus sp. HMP52]
MNNEHNKELLNRNAWEQPEAEGVVEDNKTEMYNNSGVKIVKGGTLKVNESAEHS